LVKTITAHKFTYHVAEKNKKLKNNLNKFRKKKGTTQIIRGERDMKDV